MIYFLIYLFLEVVVTVEIASRIGGLATFLEIVLSAFLGIFLLMNFRHTLSENLFALQTRQITMESFTKRNMTGLLGAILLIVPGFLSDIIGILMQFSLFSSLIINRFSRKYPTQTKSKDDNVIDAEIINDSTTLR
ncbi:FxsA family protein [Sulfuricurvum sp.]|uniref:FxsA family protein n=3 Tax=Sulfuricurvum sp. TaxID=2025608 RepID=UPI00261705BB|nr:FxsA family protein [Sulfuricurvum sp.]MDD2266952.1 FxsA family protein [Sulfuricurvum sp.]MDD2784674.1 FxsA family protein [Sulfuricurvum sp.]